MILRRCDFVCYVFQQTIKLLMNYTASPAFTLAKSGKKNIYQMPEQEYVSPGPIYNTSGLGKKEKSVSHSVGNSRRTQINHWVQQTPSPAHYQPLKSSKNQGVSITKAILRQKKNQNPDPGEYNPEIIVAKAPVYSIGAKYGSIMDDVNTNPGPGQYQTKRQMTILTKSRSQKQTGFGSSSRFHSPTNNPGVGDYQVQNHKRPMTGTIGRSLREPLTQPNIPGPDYYKISGFRSSKTLRTDRQLQKVSPIKGAFEQNDYTRQAFNKYFQNQIPETKFRSSQKFTIGFQKRQIFPGNDLPGPSNYNTIQYSKKHSRNAIIPESKYTEYNEVIDNPSPATYQLEMDNGKKYTIARAKSAATFKDHPGVGRYMISNNGKGNKGMAIPKSARTNFISKNIAGVGDYNICSSKQKFTRTICKSNRFQKIEQLPGPGDYHLQSIIGYKSKHL